MGSVSSPYARRLRVLASDPANGTEGQMYFNSTSNKPRVYSDGAWIDAGGSSGATTALDNLASVAVNTSLLPGTNDGAALGSTSKQWSDLFLAEGGVINWDNGDATLTQTGNVVALAGASLEVPDDAYDATSWNGSNQVPTKNAVRDKIESLGGGGGGYAPLSTTTIDTGSGSAQTLYTVTSGKKAIITQIVIRDVSASLAGIGDSADISWSSSGYTGYSFSDGNLAQLSGSTRAIGLLLDVGRVHIMGTAGENLRLTFNDNSIPGSAIVDVFGYEVDA